jgi:hypothetical protein
VDQPRGLDNVISGDPIDATGAAESGAFGAHGGALANKLVPMRGFKPYKLRNLLDPGPNTVRMWQDAGLGSGLVDSGQAFVDSQFATAPPC